MRRITFLLLYIFSLLIFSTAQANQERQIGFRNKYLQYMGRVKMNADNAEFYWSGTSVKLSFSGTSLNAVLKDEKANNFYEIIIDDNAIRKFKTDTNKTTYTLIENLPFGKHTIELSKCTEWDRGKTFFYGFETDARKLFKPSKPFHAIEFYGNSITCGYSVEDSVTDSGISKFENSFLSYASITARHYNSQYHCICKSGIGFMVSFARLIMPDIYNRLDPTDSLSTWNFLRFTPQIVVVDLGENDAAIVKRLDNPQFIRVFGKTPPGKDFIVNAYANFIKTLRKEYPYANIICTLGSMGSVKEGSEWPGYITAAAESLHDKKVFTFFFQFKGASGHPKIKDHKKMGDDLIAFIDKNVMW
ncbi:MAG: electron transporter RnfD [Bacteroidota bacterium]|nr:electron transporter RnfD [Bacteroidota bacterium]